MAGKSPSRPNKDRPTSRAPQNDRPTVEKAEEELSEMDIPIDEMMEMYERQIGSMQGIIIRQSIALRKMRMELLKKNGPAPEDG